MEEYIINRVYKNKGIGDEVRVYNIILEVLIHDMI